jgi:PPIC-type PPIASE domain/SurA N-terminal domain
VICLPQPIRRGPALGAALIAFVGLAACGSGAPDGVVVRVGQTVITKAATDHWMSAMTGERVAEDPPQRQAQMPRQRALSSLISSQWVIDEAADQGLKISEREVEQLFQRMKSASFPGGDAEFREFLKATGRRISDAMLEAKAELASSKIHQLLASREPKVTQAQIADYYSRHKRRFARPEQRYFDIDNLQSKAEARHARREVEQGKSFAKMALQESLERRPKGAYAGSGKEAIVRAVFSARPHVLGGPVRLYGDYSLFEVTRIVAATRQSLAQAQGSIEKRLTAEQRRRTLAEFVRAWREKWIARTDCHAGYVVPNCRQYKGPVVPEAGI